MSDIQQDQTFSSRREQLLVSLMKKGITDKLLIKAMLAVPRECFIESHLHPVAYEDKALPIPCNQSISQPFTVAYMSQLLSVKPDEKVLEIGTGSGYQASILAAMGANVYSVERHRFLYNEFIERSSRLRYNIELKLSDGSIGWAEHAPFDKIIVTAASPEIPKQLLKQLKIDGILVVPIGALDSQTMVRIRKISEKQYNYEEKGKFKFVPLIGKDGWKDDDTN